MEKYLNRLTDSVIEDSLKIIGGLCIEGVKYCGKSTSCKKLAKTVFEFQDISKKEIYKNYLYNFPEKLFTNPTPILFDEWQEIPEIWDSIRNHIDRESKKGIFLLTGSTTVKEGVTSHSGIGRIGKIRMRTMSLYESLQSSGVVSLKSLFNGYNKFAFESNKTIDDISKMIVCGGWPSNIELEEELASKSLKMYYNSLINQDISNVDGVKRNPNTADALLKSYSRNISTLAKYTTIKRDIENNGITIDEKTLMDYINTLEKLYVIENIKAWTPKIRSKYKIRTSDKKELVDPSLACTALGITSKDLLSDSETFGFMFESLCLRDLRIYIESIDGEIFHYRDQSGLEIDSILKLRNGKWGAVEIKLGSSSEVIEEAAANLLKFKENVNIDNIGNPEFLMIITAGKYAYKRPDDILVVPITCLKN